MKRTKVKKGYINWQIFFKGSHRRSHNQGRGSNPTKVIGGWVLKIPSSMFFRCSFVEALLSFTKGKLYRLSKSVAKLFTRMIRTPRYETWHFVLFECFPVPEKCILKYEYTFSFYKSEIDFPSHSILNMLTMFDQ